MKTKITLRPMAMEDVPEISMLEEELFPSPWSEKAFASDISKNPFGYHMVAEHDGKIIGYIIAWFMVEDVHIATIGVDTAWQGRGLGKLLMLMAMRWALNMETPVVTLEVRPSNERARRLYRALGFEVVGRRKNYYKATGEDALIMTNSHVNSDRLSELWQKAAAGFDVEIEDEWFHEGGLQWENSKN